MIRRANPSRLQPPPPPTQAESAGRSNSISYGYKVQDAFMVPFGTHQENVKRRCQGTVGLAEATQSKKTPPQSQPPGEAASLLQTKLVAVISGQPPSPAEPVPPSIPASLQPRGRPGGSPGAGRRDPRGDTLPLVPPPPQAPPGPGPWGAPRRRTRPRRTFRSTFRQLVQSR